MKPQSHYVRNGLLGFLIGMVVVFYGYWLSGENFERGADLLLAYIVALGIGGVACIAAMGITDVLASARAAAANGTPEDGDPEGDA